MLPDAVRKPRRLGLAKGQFTVPAAFFEPLPDDALDAFEGGAVKLLLDTHAFLWSIIDDPALSEDIRRELENTSNDAFVSAASYWEISIKYGLGKLPLPEAPDRYLPAQRKAARFDLLAIEEPEVCLVHNLPPHHRDPFDRLLVAQANCYGLVIATNDPLIQRYAVRTLWQSMEFFRELGRRPRYVPSQIRRNAYTIESQRAV